MRAILDSPDMRIDGFIGPGHVSTITGCRPYEFVARDYGKPVVVAGFEPLDILEAILMILRQLHARTKRASRTNTGASCRGTATRRRLRAMAQVFELRPYFEWRGLGFISQSALAAQARLRRVGRRGAFSNCPACA